MGSGRNPERVAVPFWPMETQFTSLWKATSSSAATASSKSIIGALSLRKSAVAVMAPHFAAIQQLLVHLRPGFLFCFVIEVQLASYVPEMLARVVEIDDLNGTRIVQLGNIPDPLGTVAHNYLQQRAAPSASGSFGIHSSAKFFCRFDRSRVRGGIRVADGIALLIPGGLREYAP